MNIYYLHLRRMDLLSIKSPLDILLGEKNDLNLNILNESLWNGGCVNYILHSFCLQVFNSSFLFTCDI